MTSPLRGEALALVRLGLPIIVVQVGMMAMGMVDVMMIGHLSGEALAAVALGNLYVWGLVIFGNGVLLAIDPVLAQGFGAGDRTALTRGMQRGLVLALAMSVPAALLALPVQPVLEALGQPAALIPDACDYVLTSIPGIFPFLAFVLLRQSLQALSRTRPIVLTIVFANIANAGLNWLLIFGNLGFPALGVSGCAWATVGARWLMAVLLLASAWPALGGYLRPWQRESFSLQPLLRMLRLGVPIGLQLQLEMGAFAATALFMGWIGATELGGHQVALTLASFSFMMPLGLSSAAAVRVGYAIGRQDALAARRAAFAALAIGAAIMAGFGVVFLSAPRALASLFTEDAGVLALAVTLLPIAGVFQVFDGLQVVANGVLRGAGDTRAPMLINLLGFWLVGVPVGLALAFPLGLGPVGLWWGLVAGLGSVAAILLGRVAVRLRGALARVVLDEGAR
jgi:MATE family multidrug resistance protein